MLRKVFFAQFFSISDATTFACVSNKRISLSLPRKDLITFDVSLGRVEKKNLDPTPRTNESPANDEFPPVGKLPGGFARSLLFRKRL